MLSVNTPAKVNLFLNIRPPRPDGYHEVVSVMQAVALFDRLDISPRLDGIGDMAFRCNVPELMEDPEENLVVRAYRLFWRETGLPPMGVNVHLEKRIPAQAGLGGGSSDASAMLQVLNHLSLAGLPDETLAAMAGRLGSDVPFFIRGGTALAAGRGERIEAVPASQSKPLPLVIVKQRRMAVSTAEAYRAYAQRGAYESRYPDHLLQALHRLGRDGGRERDGSACAEPPDMLNAYLHNDFESVLYPLYPDLANTAARMKAFGIKRPLLCGSGAAIAGFIDAEPGQRDALAALFPAEDYEVFWTETHDRGMTQLPRGDGY